MNKLWVCKTSFLVRYFRALYKIATGSVEAVAGLANALAMWSPSVALRLHWRLAAGQAFSCLP